MMFSILLQAPAKGMDWSFLFFMGLMFVVLYFFMIRPQQKKAKDAKKFRESLKKGDEVITIGGIHGTVSSIEPDDTIFMEIDRGIRIKVARWGISSDATRKTEKK